MGKKSDAIDRAMVIAEVIALGAAYIIVGCTAAVALAAWSFAVVVF